MPTIDISYNVIAVVLATCQLWWPAWVAFAVILALFIISDGRNSE